MSSNLRKLKLREDGESGDKTTAMMRNGETRLKKLIAFSNGKYNPYRIFSTKELKIATNNYNRINLKYDGTCYDVHEGFWQNRLISVMNYKKNDGGLGFEESINNIVYASQMGHNHILNLIGCCLETEIPILVFEYFHQGTLAERILGAPQPQFKRLLLTARLKIAMDIANAVAYLHLGFSRPIIIRDFKTSHIVFNEENVAKLFDFSVSISIPEGKTYVTDNRTVGTYGNAAPEYLATANANEKSDVYSFGIFLFELLTGQRIQDLELAYAVDFSLPDYVDCSLPDYVEDLSCPQKEQQLQAFRQLIFECVSKPPEDRPTIVNVAKKLRQMYRSSM